jgi:aryl-alcohol dehydrogenase-like predicted oxidoreductase
VLVYSPLQRGLLTGKYTGNEAFDDFRKGDPSFQGERFRTICDRVAQLRPIAEGYGMTVPQLVLCVTTMHPAIHCAIAGVKNPEQIEETAGACGRTISREDWHRVRALTDLPPA